MKTKAIALMALISTSLGISSGAELDVRSDERYHATATQPTSGLGRKTQEDSIHTVTAGESLSRIARTRYGRRNEHRVWDVCEFNRAFGAVGADCNILEPGTIVMLPPLKELGRLDKCQRLIRSVASALVVHARAEPDQAEAVAEILVAYYPVRAAKLIKRNPAAIRKFFEVVGPTVKPLEKE